MLSGNILNAEVTKQLKTTLIINKLSRRKFNSNFSHMFRMRICCISRVLGKKNIEFWKSGLDIFINFDVR